MHLTWQATLHENQQREGQRDWGVAVVLQTMEGDWMDDKGQLIADNYLSV